MMKWNTCVIAVFALSHVHVHACMCAQLHEDAWHEYYIYIYIYSADKMHAACK